MDTTDTARSASTLNLHLEIDSKVLPRTKRKGQKNNVKRTNNDLQNTTHKTKDREILNQLKTEEEFRKGSQFLLHMYHPLCYSQICHDWWACIPTESQHTYVY
jgi:hypothetical protein